MIFLFVVYYCDCGLFIVIVVDWVLDDVIGDVLSCFFVLLLIME